MVVKKEKIVKKNEAKAEAKERLKKH